MLNCDIDCVNDIRLGEYGLYLLAQPLMTTGEGEPIHLIEDWYAHQLPLTLFEHKLAAVYPSPQVQKEYGLHFVAFHPIVARFGKSVDSVSGWHAGCEHSGEAVVGFLIMHFKEPEKTVLELTLAVNCEHGTVDRSVFLGIPHVNTTLKQSLVSIFEAYYALIHWDQGAVNERGCAIPIYITDNTNNLQNLYSKVVSAYCFKDPHVATQQLTLGYSVSLTLQQYYGADVLQRLKAIADRLSRLHPAMTYKAWLQNRLFNTWLAAPKADEWENTLTKCMWDVFMA